MIERKTWKEFSDSGFVWWINMILHTFGWCIALKCGEDGKIIDAYPARTSFRGFSEKINTEGYEKVTEDIYNNIDNLRYDANH